MLKQITALILIALLILPFLTLPVLALSNEQEEAIQNFLDEARRTSGAPSISVSIIIEEETHFFSSGETNDEHLYELASVSKAFTALGILYLEENGLLSRTDSITDYLPWLIFNYDGEPVNMQDVRIEHLVYHTVGITQNHANVGVFAGEHEDTLQSTVEALIGAELDFLPGERFEYGTKNYNVLGMIIEVVSGLSYEEFMRIHIFEPLGLYNTFANRDDAIATGNLTQGYFTQFIIQTRTRDSKEARGAVPTGYIITNTYDMARWKSIQLGVADETSEIFSRIIPLSHQENRTVDIEYLYDIPYYYAFGWFVSQDGINIMHGGNNPSFTSFVDLQPNENIGVTVLSNSQNVNTHSIATGIVNILNGNFDVSYEMFLLRTMDIIFTSLTVLGSLFTVLFLFLGIKRQKFITKPVSKKRIVAICFLALLTIGLFVFTYLSPALLVSESNWRIALNFVSPSVLTGMIAISLSSGSLLFLTLRQKE